nr:MAG TPA: hypothetical protein [Caudoviricetes sp.]
MRLYFVSNRIKQYPYHSCSLNIINVYTIKMKNSWNLPIFPI